MDRQHGPKNVNKCRHKIALFALSFTGFYYVHEKNEPRLGKENHGIPRGEGRGV